MCNLQYSISRFFLLSEVEKENGDANDAESVYDQLEKETEKLKDLEGKIAFYEAHYKHMKDDYYNRKEKIYKIRKICVR